MLNLKKSENAAYLQKIKDAQAKIGTLDWDNYAEQIVNPDNQAKVEAAMANLLKSAANVAASTTPAELQTNLTQLTNHSAAIAEQFGKNVSANEIQELIIGAAIEYYNHVKTT